MQRLRLHQGKDSLPGAERLQVCAVPAEAWRHHIPVILRLEVEEIFTVVCGSFTDIVCNLLLDSGERGGRGRLMFFVVVQQRVQRVIG